MNILNISTNIAIIVYRYNATAQAVIRAFLNLMENIVIRALAEYLQKSMAITSIPFNRNIEIANLAFATNP